MSKKSKRQTSLTPKPAGPAPTFGGLQRKGETVEFNPDYTNVKRDLKRIGVLAGFDLCSADRTILLCQIAKCDKSDIVAWCVLRKVIKRSTHHAMR